MKNWKETKNQEEKARIRKDFFFHFAPSPLLPDTKGWLCTNAKYQILSWKISNTNFMIHILCTRCVMREISYQLNRFECLKIYMYSTTTEEKCLIFTFYSPSIVKGNITPKIVNDNSFLHWSRRIIEIA